MVDETRSLWEIYDSEVPPWRRGRFFLIIFAALSVLNQILVFAALILGGYIEQILILGIGAGIFWLGLQTTQAVGTGAGIRKMEGTARPRPAAQRVRLRLI